MKKVLFVISSLSGGGAERVLVNVANHLHKSGVEVEILKTSTKNPDNYGINEHIPIIEIPKIEKKFLFKVVTLLRQMRKIFKEHKGYTIVSFLSDNNMLSLLASIGLNNKVVISERNDPSKNAGGPFMRKVRNIIYLLADWHVFQTEDARNYFCRRIQKRSCVIPNPIFMTESEFSQYDHLTPNKYILAVGRLTAQKNYPMLINAFEKVYKKHSDYILKIYGEGPQKELLLQLIKEKGMEQAIFIHDFSNEIYKVMKQSTIYVSSSDFEGISNTMLEALTLGVPTVVTDCPVGGAKLVIRDGVNGFVIPVGDANKMADRICELLEREELRNQFSIEARKIYKRFKIESICMLWEKVL